MKTLFSPLYPLMLYCFLAITTLHQQLLFVPDIHLELIVLVSFIALAITHLFSHEVNPLRFDQRLFLPFLLAVFYASAPLITSFFTKNYLFILNDDEYKTFFKILLFSPLLFFFMSHKKYSEKILSLFIGSYFLFSLIFFYRFFVLKEVRAFDLRPLLHIRHGDPNFLCTFFSMMIPLSLLLSYKKWEQKNYFHMCFCLLSSLLLFLAAYFTESRMGLIAILVGLFYLLTRPLFKVPREIIVVAFFIALSGLLALKGDHIVHRFLDIEDKSNSDRYLTWINGLKVMEAHPLFGVGMHRARDYFYENTGYPPFQSEVFSLEVHNTFLKLGAELGIVGLSAFLFIFGWSWSKAVANKSKDRPFLISSLLIFTLSCLTIPIAYKDLIILHLFAIAALSTEENYANNILDYRTTH